jgi:hypothetical protein
MPTIRENKKREISTLVDAYDILLNKGLLKERHLQAMLRQLCELYVSTESEDSTDRWALERLINKLSNSILETRRDICND